MAQPRYVLCFAPEAIDHVAAIEKKFHGLLESTITSQLTHEPNVETRNRKPLEMPAPFTAAWELRCGPGNRFRVFYTVDDESLVVNVLAVGVKVRSRLYFAGEELIQ